MTLRYTVLGMALLFGISVWAWYQPAHDHNRPTESRVSDSEANTGEGNQDEAARRYRNSQATHWRQLAIQR